MQGNLISSNTSLIDVCGCASSGGPPCQSSGGQVFACSLGDGALLGTGYQDQQLTDHAATGWLTSTAPLTPGQTFTIRWTGFDSGDGTQDSTTLVDHWQWIVTQEVPVATTRVQNPQ